MDVMDMVDQALGDSMWLAVLVGGAVILLWLLPRLLRGVSKPRDFGHIYVISNVASFGPDVWKVGMTKMPNPRDRINKHANTHVPFDFVVNVLVESKDVTADEKRIHRAIRRYRVNWARPQKEFFRAPFSAVVDAIEEVMPNAKWLCRDENPEQLDYIATTTRRNGRRGDPRR